MAGSGKLPPTCLPTDEVPPNACPPGGRRVLASANDCTASGVRAGSSCATMPESASPSGVITRGFRCCRHGVRCTSECHTAALSARGQAGSGGTGEGSVPGHEHTLGCASPACVPRGSR
jgi:hypothetical protein